MVFGCLILFVLGEFWCFDYFGRFWLSWILGVSLDLDIL